MTMAGEYREVIEDVAQYYTTKLYEHGSTPQGADWRSEESQLLRFTQLSQLWQGQSTFSVNDIGCGYGALARWLGGRRNGGRYVGYDVSEPMIDAARRYAGDLTDC